MDIKRAENCFAAGRVWFARRTFRLKGLCTMTLFEASEKYNIPPEILKEYESWGLCSAVKKVMGSWQYDDTDIENLSLIMTLHNLNFKPQEIEEFMNLKLSGSSCEKLKAYSAKKETTFLMRSILRRNSFRALIILGIICVPHRMLKKINRIGGINMKYAKLGHSDLNVSRICLGCMGFGDAAHGQHSWTVDEPHTREIVKHALELGINFFDTAIAYQSGTSEQYLGRALRDFAKRDEVVVATKFLPRTQEEIAAGISGQQHIERMLDKSLQNLGMDYVDLYIYHMWDHQTPLYDIMEGLNNVVKAGKARYIGISNCFAYQLAKANDLAEKEGFAKFVSVQGHYNLIFREEEREMAKLCREDNIAMTPYSALAGGRLSKHPGETSKRLEEDSYAHLKYDSTAKQDAVIINRVAEIADKRGVTMTEVSLAWLLTRVTAPVAGATKLHHVDGAAKATDLELTAAEIAYLDEPYVPHKLVGVMAQNTAASADETHVWSTGDQKI